ncbi:carboxymuconolactone decarboxylase family protein [Paraburkholderia sp. Ac-20340]|uniref:carboxymuconolactone decarboxylase family protein n=1 Tax=Paraburkholderia sp. Ac-20340 TaxID=2703888 RepID=UPI00197F1AE7|nr:carboxymuconolactone decarboxylase family protein [Paraburkholderia sp. Ac-20340]MBN3854805.1 carboxymuconolactone decarboxylase family protein [Paraburkholderia sp. Ac-20340]
MAQSVEQERIKQKFIAARGYWRPWTDAILKLHPDFLERYADYAGQPARKGPLSPRMVELVYVALDASSAHMYGPGLSTHLKGALNTGATPSDVLDVLHLVAMQGLEAVFASTAILGQELDSQLPGERRSAGIPAGEAFKAAYPVAASSIEYLAQFDAEYAQVVTDFMQFGGTGKGLSANERLLVQIALNACFTAFNPEAVRLHIRAALNTGISASEILQVIQLGAHLSVHGTALGAVSLNEIIESVEEKSHESQ